MPRRCPYCLQPFEPSKFRPSQRVCSSPECQRRRRTEYHRARIRTDPAYAQIARDSRSKWCQEHPGYQRQYRNEHPEAVQRNRQTQRGRDRKRHLATLVKNNAALDLKHASAEVWLIGKAAGDLDKNNLAASRFLLVQPLAFAPAGS